MSNQPAIRQRTELPFSRAEGPERGLYVELAELVASRLGLRPEYAWFLSH